MMTVPQPTGRTATGCPYCRTLSLFKSISYSEVGFLFGSAFDNQNKRTVSSTEDGWPLCATVLKHRVRTHSPGCIGCLCVSSKTDSFAISTSETS